MKQALHIFLKDVRGLRIPISVLMAAIAWFAVFEARQGLHLGNPGELGLVTEIILAAAVWFLIARAVHEDSLPDQNQFWLTRPYNRSSLLFAKILMAVLVVGVPLFVANCVILATLSLPVTGNLWGLVLRQLITAIWLIAPPLAIASVTRTFAQNVVGWLIAVAISALTYFPGTLHAQNDFRAMNERYALTAALVLIVLALWRQYSRRATIASRIMIAAAVLLPAPPFPESAALAIEQLRDSQPQITSRILLTTDARSVTEPLAFGYRAGRDHCVSVPVNAGGLPQGWRVEVLSQNDTFEAGGKTWSSGWHQPREYTNGFAHEGNLSICASPAEVQNLGQSPAALRTSIALKVLAPAKSVLVPATLSPIHVPGIGRCQFRNDLPHHYLMVCESPVWVPPQGNVVVANDDTWSSAIARTEYAWTPFELLPGFSPVYKWVTMPMDEGTKEPPPFGAESRFGLTSMIRFGAAFEFRTTKQVAVVRREIAVREVRFSNAR